MFFYFISNFITFEFLFIEISTENEIFEDHNNNIVFF